MQSTATRAAVRNPFIRVLAFLLIALSSSFARSAPPAESRSENLVLAFYYPWYGTPDGPGGKSRNNQTIHWEHIDPAAKKISSSTNYPVSGAYDSHDPTVIERHTQLAKASGIDAFIISWWGKGTFEDQAVPLILDSCAKSNIKACIYYEEVPKGGTPATVAAEIVDITSRYAVHPSYFRITRDGESHPVIFLYGRAIEQLGLEKWKEVQQLLAKTSPRPFLIGDNFSKLSVDTFDGVHSYGPAGDLAAAQKRGETFQTWAKRTMPWWANCGEGGKAARDSGKISCCTVFPGYDDRVVRKPGLVVKREGGDLYQELWREAIAAKPDWILITSFNEWHEGSEIEPSIEEGSKYIIMTAEWAAKFKASQAGVGK